MRSADIGPEQAALDGYNARLAQLHGRQSVHRPDDQGRQSEMTTRIRPAAGSSRQSAETGFPRADE
jgi:hypothetical protein